MNGDEVKEFEANTRKCISFSNFHSFTSRTDRRKSKKGPVLGVVIARAWKNCPCSLLIRTAFCQVMLNTAAIKMKAWGIGVLIRVQWLEPQTTKGVVAPNLGERRESGGGREEEVGGEGENKGRREKEKEEGGGRGGEEERGKRGHEKKGLAADAMVSRGQVVSDNPSCHQAVPRGTGRRHP